MYSAEIQRLEVYDWLWVINGRPYDFTTKISDLQGLVHIHLRVWIYALYHGIFKKNGKQIWGNFVKMKTCVVGDNNWKRDMERNKWKQIRDCGWKGGEWLGFSYPSWWNFRDPTTTAGCPHSTYPAHAAKTYKITHITPHLIYFANIFL